MHDDSVSTCTCIIADVAACYFSGAMGEIIIIIIIIKYDIIIIIRNGIIISSSLQSDTTSSSDMTLSSSLFHIHDTPLNKLHRIPPHNITPHASPTLIPGIFMYILQQHLLRDQSTHLILLSLK